MVQLVCLSNTRQISNVYQYNTTGEYSVGVITWDTTEVKTANLTEVGGIQIINWIICSIMLFTYPHFQIIVNEQIYT